MIFGKHVFRSIRKEPLQPIMIIAVIMISVAVMILCVSLPINIYRNEHEGLDYDEWSADLDVVLKSTANERLIFEDDVERILADRAEVIGEFSLTGFLEDTQNDGAAPDELIKIGAFDLSRADSFYEIRYVEYGKFTNNNLKTSAVISEGFADDKGLFLGDTFTVNVLGEKFSYTVEAIAKEMGVFKERQCIVDISGIRRVLAERSPLIASLSDDFDPYTKIHIKVNEGEDIEAIKTELEAHESFANKRVELVSDSTSEDSVSMILTITTVMPALLLLIVASMMIVSSLELLDKKRQHDIALFRIIGADRSHMNLLLCIESLVYGFVGGVLGCLLAVPGISALNTIYGFEYSIMSFGISEVVLGLGSSLAFTSVCTLLHIRKQNQKTLSEELSTENLDTDRAFSPKKLLYGVPSAALAAITLIIPPRYGYISAFLLLLSFVIFIYVMSPYVIGGLASLISRVSLKAKRGMGDVFLASRSCENSYPLRHAGRIMSILLTVFISLSCVISAVNTQLVDYIDFASFEYIGMRVDDDTKERIRELDFVVATAESIINPNVIIGNTSVTGIALSGGVDECFNGNILPKTIPVGDGLALSHGVAAMLDLRVGDKVDLVIADIPCTLTLVELVDTYADFAYYDADYVGNGRDMFCILTDGSSEAKETIFSIFDERGLECLDKDAFFGLSRKRVEPQITVIRIMFYVMILMTAVGIFNILADQRMSRAYEFEILRQNGKTKRGIISLQAVEITYLVIFAAVVAVISSAVIIYALDTAAVSFGMKLYF